MSTATSRSTRQVIEPGPKRPSSSRREVSEAVTGDQEHLVQPGSQLLLPRIVEAGLEHRNELRPGAFVDEHHEAKTQSLFVFAVERRQSFELATIRRRFIG